jgi:dCTP deaminase
MIFTGALIKEHIRNGTIICEPLNIGNIGTNSIDVTLGSEVKILGDKNGLMKTIDGCVDPYAVQFHTHVDMKVDERGMYFIAEPNQLYICHTEEIVGSKVDVPIMEGKSSLGRLGVFIHVTAGFGDIGFIGTWTLEIVVVKRTRLYVGMKIAQIGFHKSVGDIDMPYDKKVGAKYQNQYGAVGSRYNENDEVTIIK